MAMPPPQEVLAEKHRKAALEILEFTKPPEKRKITFSIVARCVDGGKKVPLSLSLDDNITTILERIQDEFELQQAPSVRVEWSSVIGAKQTSELTEQNVEETLGLLWKRSVQPGDMLVVDVHGKPLMENRRPTSPAGDTKTEERTEIQSS